MILRPTQRDDQTKDGAAGALIYEYPSIPYCGNHATRRLLSEPLAVRAGRMNNAAHNSCKLSSVEARR
ncbi:MAG: hypothetical protein IJM54_04125 [Thermoguttaceae bacterium]|nr:hypothetical protein [Thermoguttaceae bacterium]